jgi:hypothetical protein
MRIEFRLYLANAVLLDSDFPYIKAILPVEDFLASRKLDLYDGTYQLHVRITNDTPSGDQIDESQVGDMGGHRSSETELSIGNSQRAPDGKDQGDRQ